MLSHAVLWVDFRNTRTEPDLCSSLPPIYCAQRLFDVPQLLQVVQHSRPWAVCFEYDVPDAGGLAALMEVKIRHSSLPIIMLTEKLGGKLETLALRLCLWDYLVKPMPVRRLCDCLRSIGAGAPRQDYSAIKFDTATPVVDVLPGKTSAAAAWRLPFLTCRQLHRESCACRRRRSSCDLSRFQFSRNFKREQGLTFRDFVVQTRIQRAAELMRQPKRSRSPKRRSSSGSTTSHTSRACSAVNSV